MGMWLFEVNFYLFGEFAYYFPFALFVLNYLCYKRGYELGNFRRKELFGFAFAFFACLLLFASFYPGEGLILQAFYSAFSSLFGYVGSGILGLLSLLFSIILLFPNFIKEVFKIELNFTKLERLENKIKNALMQIFGGEKDDFEFNEAKDSKFTPKTSVLKEDFQKQSPLNEIPSSKNPKENLQNELYEEIKTLNIKANESLNKDFTLLKDAILILKKPLNSIQKQESLSDSSSKIKSFIQKASRMSISLNEDLNFISEKEVDMIPERFLKPKNKEDFKKLGTKENLDIPSYQRKNIQLEIPSKELKPNIFSKELKLREGLKQRTKLEQEYKEYENKKQNENNDSLSEFSPLPQSSKYNITSGIDLQKTQQTPLQNEPENLDFNKQNFESKSLEESKDNTLDFMPIVEEFKHSFEAKVPIIKMSELEQSDLTLQENSPQTQNCKEIKPLEMHKEQENLNLEQKSSAFIKSKEIELNQSLLREIEQGEAEIPHDFTLPSLEFLSAANWQKQEINESEIDKKIYDLLEKLRRFKIGGDVINTYTGPVVTTFEFRPSADVKVSRILNLQDDLAMALKAKSIRIQAPIPGKDVVGIEVPNEKIETIYLREILESEVFKNAKSSLTIALGKDIVGNAFVTDLKKLPHLLIAGTTGSGKSVGINSMLLSLLYRNSPKTLRLMMIDPKMLEFSIYNDIPHLLTPVITDPKKAINALSNMVAEMERRYRLMADAKTKNIENYNEKMKELGGEELPFIVVIIDELADLMMNGGKDVEFYIARLAQMARASGIHLIVATQRPSVDVVTGLIKANLPSRISYKVGQKIDSKVILDTMGAESLLGRGDCLFTPPGTSNIIRLHAPFASELEIEKVVEFLKAQQSVVYDESFLRDEQGGNLGVSGFESGELDELYEEAKRVILEDQKTSISYLQRRLKIGYNRAANIIEQLSENGVLSKPDAKGQREILV